MSGSMRQRLRLKLLAPLSLIMLCLLILMHAGIKHLGQQYVKGRLQHDAESLLSAIEHGPQGFYINEQRLPTVYHRPESGHYFKVVTPQQRLSSRSLWDRSANVPSLSPGARQFLDQNNDDQHWLAWAEGVRIRDTDFVVWVAEDVTAFDTTLWRFTGIATLFILVATTILVTLQNRSLSQEFQVFQRLQQAISTLPSGGQLPPAQDLPKEVTPLVEEIGRLLAQLENRLKRSRQATGNLAHEMKRPLQLMSSDIHALPEEWRGNLLDALHSLQSLLDRELKRARIAGTVAPGRHFAPAEDLPHLYTAFSRIYPAIQLHPGDIPARLLPYDRDDMLELLGNLIDNACKHASKQVIIKLTHGAAGISIRVSDDGKGIPPDALAQLQTRGIKLDESKQGHGLGLSICRDIVDSYHGQLAFNLSELGGLQANVHLPMR
jgi:signal transduction histidine kinase